jgi:hypothetical protein
MSDSIIIIIIVYSILAGFSAICLSVRLSFGHQELSLYLTVYVHLKTHLKESKKKTDESIGTERDGNIVSCRLHIPRTESFLIRN